MSLTLTDSNLNGAVSKNYYEDSAAYMNAVDELTRQFANGIVQVVSLQSYTAHHEIEVPVWYEVESYISKGGHQVVDKCNFFTSHYIGRFAYKGADIIISPRFGNVFSYLIGYATNLYMPIGGSDIAYNNQNNSFWLIALLWKAMLNRALTTGQVPKEYHFITKNLKNYRGRLSVSRHIHKNLCNATRFYCSYQKLSMDNAINQTIRTTYFALKQKGVASLVAEFEAYDKYLESMGVTYLPHKSFNFDSIRYTRLNASYQPVINLSKTILLNISAETSKGKGVKQDVAYFVDIADLWEIYLLKLLRNNLPDAYHVYSPNAQHGTNLLDYSIREIRPDIIIEKDNRVVLIIDAKYKDYHSFGHTAKYGISRDDLYQMSTYLYHYGTEDAPIAGIFTSPVSCVDGEIHVFSGNPKHKIGLINMDIETANEDISQLHVSEKHYIDQIVRLLAEL